MDLQESPGSVKIDQPFKVNNRCLRIIPADGCKFAPEQLLVDFYLNHDEQDENWHIANSYWKRG